MKQIIKNNFYKILISVIIILALIIRLFYVIKMPYTEIQHDLDLSYAYGIVEGHLPETNSEQYYHPPLNQMIFAIFIKIQMLFTDNEELMNENLQFLTVMYSMILIYVLYKISKEIGLKKKHILYIMVLGAFHPTLIILSGSLNNDNLCLLLMMWSILRAIKWYKKSNIRNIAFLAFVTGLAVMTKTNGAIVAIPILYAFIIRLYRDLKKNEDKKKTLIKYLRMFFIFGIISLPIGLWYHVRNYILFNQPLLYVLDPDDTSLYVGNYTLLQRFFPISKEFYNIYCDAYRDYNLPVYLIKCSLFGEFIWKIDYFSRIIYGISIMLNYIFTVVGIVCIIKNMIKRTKKKIVYRMILFLLYVTNLFSFIIMNLKLPYGCSMDFRYIVPTLFVQAYFICFEFEKNEKRNNQLFTVLFEMTFVLMLFANYIIL